MYLHIYNVLDFYKLQTWHKNKLVNNMPPFLNSRPKSVTRISMFWTQAKRLYLNFNLSFEYRMYANRIRIRILKSKFKNSNFVSHPQLKWYETYNTEPVDRSTFISMSVAVASVAGSQVETSARSFVSHSTLLIQTASSSPQCINFTSTAVKIIH